MPEGKGRALSGVRYDRLLSRTVRFGRSAGDEIDGAALLLGFRSYL